MTTSLLILLVAASILRLAVHAEPIPNQYVLKPPHQSSSEPLPLGQLWRFNVEKGSKGFNEVLAAAQEHELDLWQVAHSHVDVYTPTSDSPLLESLRAIPHSLSANITSPERASSHRPTTTTWDLTSLQNSTYHAEYHPLFEIDIFVADLAAMYPDVVKVKKLGHSGLGREMLSLSISKDNDPSRRRGKGVSPKSTEKLAFVIMGAQHAREWVATATSIYLAHALASNSSEPHSLSHLLDVFDFHIIPVPNPDGYDYTWETDRYWYKTRQKMGSQNRCFGLDMNRNWGYKWKGRAQDSFTGSRRSREPTDPCSHWYPGHRAFEAPEVNNIANYVITIPNLVGFLDLRSYGQMLSSPFSYSCRVIPKDAEDQIEAGLGAARALQMTYGTEIATGRLCNMLYTAPGNVVDWMYKRARVKYSYALHLRDTGTYGFSLPSRWIRPVGEETGELVKYLAKFIAKKMKRNL